MIRSDISERSRRISWLGCRRSQVDYITVSPPIVPLDYPNDRYWVQED